MSVAETAEQQTAHPKGHAAKPFLLCWLLYGLVIFLLTAPKTVPIDSFDYRAMYSAGVLVRTEPRQLFSIAHQNEVQNRLVSHGEVAIPFFHPSYEALLFAPFSLAAYRLSYHLFQAFNLILLLLCFFVGRDHFSKVIPFLQPRPGLMFFVFLPVLIVFISGQDSLVALLLLCITLTCLQKKRIALAGAMTALAMFKFQVIGIVGILLALRWHKKFAISFIAITLLLAALSITLVGTSGSTQFLSMLMNASLIRDQSQGAQASLAIHPLAMVNLNALFFAAGTRYLSPHVAAFIVAIASLALFLWCAIRVTDRAIDDKKAFSIAILCGLLISGHLYIHDFTLLLLPATLIGSRRFGLIALCYALPIVGFRLGADLYFLAAIPLLVFTIIVLAEGSAVHPPGYPSTP